MSDTSLIVPPFTAGRTPLATPSAAAQLMFRPLLHSFFQRDLRHDFFLMQNAGFKHAVAFGPSLRDVELGLTPETYHYVAELPVGRDLPHRWTLAGSTVRFALNDHRSFAKLVDEERGSVHLAFTYCGRQLDILLLPETPPLAPQVAEAQPIGLNALAVNAQGMVYLTPRYLADLGDQTLTIRPGLPRKTEEACLDEAIRLKRRLPSLAICLP